MEENELQKQLTEIAKKEGYVLLPKSYYSRLFDGFEKLKREVKRARNGRDKWRDKYKELRLKELHNHRSPCVQETNK